MPPGLGLGLHIAQFLTAKLTSVSPYAWLGPGHPQLPPTPLPSSRPWPQIPSAGLGEVGCSPPPAGASESLGAPTAPRLGHPGGHPGTHRGVGGSEPQLPGQGPNSLADPVADVCPEAPAQKYISGLAGRFGGIQAYRCQHISQNSAIYMLARIWGDPNCERHPYYTSISLVHSPL